MDREGHWSGVRCDAPKYLAVVCKFAPSGSFTYFQKSYLFFTCMFFKIETRWFFSYLERTECVDAYSNCEDKIKLEPGACKEYPEFAWQSCPSTCGICGTKGSVMHETSSIHRKRNPIVIDYLYLEYSTLIFCTYLIINPFF